VVSGEQVRILNTFIHSQNSQDLLRKNVTKITDNWSKLNSDNQFCCQT